ncbi:pyridoxal phosphate-dependent aminotransferase [Agriterribacter sp.]|uniref:pyridoxal phosphate-dependent aminotransferase n=1 Tax=Agriterribacter sp. TaxID=2821509 RepID=UPI002C812F50|nr:pyridoxal phosphate-dependent aminotransferase [Agriterribacter sp.]HRP54828.1 pyridoxal phosphate-dependent aminotransferase [Agriterribacter sp.]
MENKLHQQELAPENIKLQEHFSRLAETLIGSEIVKLGGEIREKIKQGEKIYNFTIGDFDPEIFPIPKELENEIIDAYRKHFTNYPAAEGNVDLREAIAAFLRQKEGLQYNTSEILVASGGRPLIYAFFRTIADKDDKIIYAVPSWNNNHYTHFVEGIHCEVEASAENNFMPTAADIAPHIKDAVILALCSPQNPTGTTFTRDALEAICDMVLEENSRRGEGEKKLYVLYDQMYWQLTHGDILHYDPVSLRPQMKAYTVYIDAISKCFAATGVRVGWAMGPERIMSKMKAILSHVGAWAPMAEQKAVARFLLQYNAVDDYLQQFKTEISLRLRKIYDGFMRLKKEGLPVNAIAPQAAIYLTIRVNATGMRTAAGRLLEEQKDVTGYLLNEAGIAVVPFYAFGASKDSSWYRLSVGACKKEEIDAMIEALSGALRKLK